MSLHPALLTTTLPWRAWGEMTAARAFAPAGVSIETLPQALEAARHVAHATDFASHQTHHKAMPKIARRRSSQVQIPSDQCESALRILEAAGLAWGRYNLRAMQYHPDFGPHPTIVYLDGPVSGVYTFDLAGMWLRNLETDVNLGLYCPDS